MGLPSPCTLWPQRLRRSSGEPSGLPGATVGLWTMLAPNGGRMWKDELKLIQCQYLFYWGACSRQTFRCLDPVAEYNSVSQTWKLQNENGHNLDLEYIIYIYTHTYIYIYI